MPAVDTSWTPRSTPNCARRRERVYWGHDAREPQSRHPGLPGRPRQRLPIRLASSAATNAPPIFASTSKPTTEISATVSSGRCAGPTFAKMLRDKRILFLGDHHRDSDLHRQMLELIDWACANGHRPVLGIEAVGIQDDANLQEYLAGGITLARLRARIARRWPLSWLESDDVDHSFFRQLLSRAKTKAMPVFCLEPTPRHTLTARDTIIASNIRRALRLHQDRLLIVIVGHAHLLGRGHLTGRVGVPSIAVGARLSPTLEALAESHPPIGAGEFLRTERGVLFFSSAVHRRADSDD